MIPAWVLGLGRGGRGHRPSYVDALRDRGLAARGRRRRSARRRPRSRSTGASTRTRVGGLVAWRLGGIALALGGLMSILLVVRHTRAEEETGRAELVGAGVVGRHAPLAAALITAALAEPRARRDRRARRRSPPASASPARSRSAPLRGRRRSCSPRVAAAAAQIAESARGANGLAIGVLGGAFALRAVGDAGPHWLAWLSPLGWAQAMRPYGGERWWLIVRAARARGAARPCARDAARRPARPRRGHPPAAPGPRARHAAHAARARLAPAARRAGGLGGGLRDPRRRVRLDRAGHRRRDRRQPRGARRARPPRRHRRASPTPTWRPRSASSR